MLLRTANLSDLEPLLAMMEEFNRGERIEMSRERTGPALVRLLGDATLGCVIMLDDHGFLIGYAVLTWGFDLEFGGRDAFLTELFIRPDRRRGGCGRRLIEELARVARTEGAGAIHLGVYPTNAAALALYRSAGFARIPRDFYSRVL